MKRQLARFGVLTFAVAGLAMGSFAVAGASSGSIDTTGPDSHNSIEWHNKLNTVLNNNNGVNLKNDNPQTANTGEAEVEHNTTGGSATSGDAMNESMLDASVTFDNSSSGLADMYGGNMGSDTASIYKTGPDSHNKIEFKNEANLTVNNSNNVQITNNNTQKATSGEAEVEGNTTGGDATSGGASNTSSNTFSIDITN